MLPERKMRPVDPLSVLTATEQTPGKQSPGGPPTLAEAGIDKNLAKQARALRTLSRITATFRLVAA
jgi:hypothetical protein